MGVSLGRALPEGLGQTGEEADQGQGQHQEEEAEDCCEDQVQGGGQEGHLEPRGPHRAASTTRSTQSHEPWMPAPKPWVSGHDLALFLGVNLWGLAQQA